MTRVFEEPRDNKVVHRRASMLEAEVGERDAFEYAILLDAREMDEEAWGTLLQSADA